VIVAMITTPGPIDPNRVNQIGPTTPVHASIFFFKKKKIREIAQVYPRSIHTLPFGLGIFDGSSGLNLN
jgi:hypothetical protein